MGRLINGQGWCAFHAGITPLWLTKMRKNGLWLWLMMGMFAVAVAANGKNVVREVRKTIKDARYEEDGNEAKKVADRLTAAEKSLLDAVPSETNVRRKAALYFTAARVQCRFNDIENEKIYLGRAYDTTLYYNSIYKVYQYMRQCDSVESAAGGKVKYKFRAPARKCLLDYRPNLLNGARFYLRKKNYAEACRFLDLYLSSAYYPMLRPDFLDQTDSTYFRAAYWMVSAAYSVGDYEKVVRCVPVALRYHGQRQFVQEYLCRSYLAQGDTLQWLQALKKGILNFPDHTYFFMSLVEYLNRNRRYDEAILFADRMIQYDPKNYLFWYAKAVACMRKEDYPACVDNCDVVLTLDSLNVEANYFKGLAYSCMAKEISEKMEGIDLRSANYQTLRMDMLECYSNARKPLERLRSLSPDKADRWAPLLYQVYQYLNEGEKFEEMERVMQSLNKGEKGKQ